MVNPSYTSYKNLRALVADDDRNVLTLICRLLRELGFGTIEPAIDGLSAIQKLEEAEFDLVIADWMMLPMTGLDLIEHLRANPRWKDLPFIMVTAKNDRTAVDSARKAGVTGYLLKPFRIADLKKQVDRCLEMSPREQG